MNNSQSFMSAFVRNQLKDKLCSLCLSQNRHYVRNVSLLKKIQEDFPKLLRDFNFEEERICWECNGHLMKLVRFQNRINKARDILNQLSCKAGGYMPKLNSLSPLKRTQLRGNVLIAPTSSGVKITNVEHNKQLKFVPCVPKVAVKATSSGLTNVNHNGPLQSLAKMTNIERNKPMYLMPTISVTSRMPEISSVSSLSQPTEQGKQYMVPTAQMLPTLTTEHIEIKTEPLDTDLDDISQEPSDDETLSIDSRTAQDDRLDLDDFLDTMYEQKPKLSLPVHNLSSNMNRAPILHPTLANKPQNIPVNPNPNYPNPNPSNSNANPNNPDPNRIKVTSGPSQQNPIGRGNTNIVVLSSRMVHELRERERIYLNNLKIGFICDKCVMSVKTEVAYKAHMLKHLPQTGPEVCDICELRFKKKEHLNLHYKSHFRAYSCGQCRGMTFVCRHWSTMEMHINTHDVPCSCDLCGVAFKSKELLREHKESTHMIECPLCKNKFFSRASFEEHTRFRHVDVKCEKCNMVMKGLNGLKSHQKKNKNCSSYGSDIVMIKTEDGTPQPYCAKCNKFFKTRFCLTSHLRSRAHFSGWYECDYCGKKYSSKVSLISHIQFSHMKTGKLSKCDTCGKTFRFKKVLARHIDFVHLKKKLEAKYCCDICGKAFTNKTILKNHQQIHTGIRAFQCELCPWNFTQKSTLHTHMKLKHKKIGANSATPAVTSAANVKKRKGRKKKKQGS